MLLPSLGNLSQLNSAGQANPNSSISPLQSSRALIQMERQGGAGTFKTLQTGAYTAQRKKTRSLEHSVCTKGIYWLTSKAASPCVPCPRIFGKIVELYDNPWHKDTLRGSHLRWLRQGMMQRTPKIAIARERRRISREKFQEIMVVASVTRSEDNCKGDLRTWNIYSRWGKLTPRTIKTSSSVLNLIRVIPLPARRDHIWLGTFRQFRPASRKGRKRVGSSSNCSSPDENLVNTGPKVMFYPPLKNNTLFMLSVTLYSTCFVLLCSDGEPDQFTIYQGVPN